MSLIDVKQHLQAVRVTSLGSIAEHFHCDSGLMRDMLGFWVRKGCVRQFSKTPGCGERCAQCGQDNYEIYEWV